MNQSSSTMHIRSRAIGAGHPCYIIAEMSANHNQDFDKAVSLVHAAKEAGADAIKLQTYTPDTITLDCDDPCFRIDDGLWAGQTLYKLYEKAYTPWDWQGKLKSVADSIGIDFFSSAFDPTSVDFLETLHVPAYKIASFEIVDIGLIEKVARTGKPIIISTGMARLEEIAEAVAAARGAGATQIALLKCNSAYPAPPEEMNLRTIRHLSEAFRTPAGLSDHTQGIHTAVAAVCLGASIIEKHFHLSKEDSALDGEFSLDPAEFKEMVKAIREAEAAMGEVNYTLTEAQEASIPYRRSLFVVEDIKAGDALTRRNVRSIRPGQGLHPRYLNEVLERRAAVDIKRGTPLAWHMMRT